MLWILCKNIVEIMKIALVAVNNNMQMKEIIDCLNNNIRPDDFLKLSFDSPKYLNLALWK
jgi:hypothetical protein